MRHITIFSFLVSVLFSSITLAMVHADEFVSEADVVESAGTVTQEEFRRTEIEAQNRITGTSGPETDAKSAAAGGGGPTYVITTEEIPGASCTCIAEKKGNNASANEKDCSDPNTRKYKCEVSSGLTAFQNMFREIVKWVVTITMLLGVVAIVGAGILWTWGSDSEEYTKKAKGWVMNILIGLILLFTFRYILGFLAPWIFQ